MEFDDWANESITNPEALGKWPKVEELLRSAFDAGHPKWISVEDDPKCAGEYLIYPYDYAWTGFFNKNWKSKDGKTITPTHWMPLPEPPTKREIE